MSCSACFLWSTEWLLSTQDFAGCIMRSTSVFSSHVVLLPLLVHSRWGRPQPRRPQCPRRMELRTELWVLLASSEAAAVHEAVALSSRPYTDICSSPVEYMRAVGISHFRFVCLIWDWVLLASSCSKLPIADKAAAVHEAVTLAHVLILIYA